MTGKITGIKQKEIKIMFKNFFTIFALLSFLMTSAVMLHAADKGKLENIIKQGDKFYAKREKMLNVSQAINTYKEAVKLDKNCFEAVWRLSRTYYYYGTRISEKYDDRRKTVFNEGMEWGKKAKKIDPKRPEGYFWYGTNLGSWGEANGVMKSLSIRHDLEEVMLKTAKIDPAYEAAGAFRVLGRLKFRLPGLFGGDNDESIEYLRKAIKLGPTSTMNYVFLAETLMDEDDYTGAKKALEKAIKMTPDPRWLPEAKKDKAQAKDLMIEVLEELED